jgi:hypothetical protein
VTSASSIEHTTIAHCQPPSQTLRRFGSLLTSGYHVTRCQRRQPSLHHPTPTTRVGRARSCPRVPLFDCPTTPEEWQSCYRSSAPNPFTFSRSWQPAQPRSHTRDIASPGSRARCGNPKDFPEPRRLYRHTDLDRNLHSRVARCWITHVRRRR